MQNTLAVSLVFAAVLMTISIVLKQELKLLLSTKTLLFLLFALSIITLFPIKVVDSRILLNNQYLYLVIIISCIPTAFFFGLITKLILQKFYNEETSFIKALSSTKEWFISSLIACFLGVLGNLLIFEIFSRLERPLRVFLVLIWTALTFVLYPLLIASKGNPFYALPKTFKITLKTIHKWFYLYLVVIFVSGEIFQLFSIQFTQVSWVGGYIFQSVWYQTLQESLNLSSYVNFIIHLGFIFINAVIATLVKMRVTRMLIDLKYL